MSSEERQFLELVYEHFDRDLTWPEPGTIKRQLYQRGLRRVDMDTLLARLTPSLVRRAEFGGTKIRLTLAGFRAIYKATETTDFMCFLRLALEKYGQLHSDKTLATADVVQRCGLDSKRLQKLDIVLQAEPFVAYARRRAPDGGPFEWEVSDEVTRYEDVFDLAAYLLRRRQELEKLADSDIPPVHLLAAEGIPFRNRPPGAPDVFEKANLAEDAAPPRLDVHPLIEHNVRALFDGAKYDLGVCAALRAVEVRVRTLSGLGNELIGVDLMNRAFGPAGPLADASLPKGEQNGMRSLFVGAYAVLRNPTGHRDLDYLDSREAADSVHTASLLMRILDRIEGRIGM